MKKQMFLQCRSLESNVLIKTHRLLGRQSVDFEEAGNAMATYNCIVVPDLTDVNDTKTVRMGSLKPIVFINPSAANLPPEGLISKKCHYVSGRSRNKPLRRGTLYIVSQERGLS